MNEINTVVLNFIACLANSRVRAKIEETYEIKITSLENLKLYTQHPTFKNKVVTNENFSDCVSYALKRLLDEKFLKYLENNRICYIVFYKKVDKSNINILDSKFKQEASIMDSLKSIIHSYSIDNEVLTLFIHPVPLFKQKIYDSKDDILKYFNEHDKKVTSIDVKFMHNKKTLDSLSETLLEIGFNIK
ncbi:hypothetical protein ACSW8S_19155 (plasmid) [Clostridium perfringens]